MSGDSGLSKQTDRVSVAEKGDAESFQKAKADEVIKLLKSNPESGLKTEEAEERLKLYGYNEVPEKKANLYLSFAKKFWGLTAWMLEAIIILSWFLQRYADLYIVTGLLVLARAFGIPCLVPLPITVTLFVMALSGIFAFALNDSVKVALVKNAKISW
jgi:magnesium-transporting ATPase (P-type)